MAVLLTLGGVIFQGFEIPERINTGGEQALVVHKLPGGARTIDAMGADHRDIAWSGRFRSANAESRARLLDGYRIGGQPLLLQWSTYRYRVIVRSFEANYEQPFEIPYSISCLVVEDQSAPVLSGIPLLDEVIGSDLGRALGLSDSIAVASVASAVATVQQTINTANTLQGAPASTIQQVTSTLSAAQQAVGATITASEASLAAGSAIAAGGSPAAIAGTLSSQATGLGQLSQLYQLSSTLTRMGKNLVS